MTSASGSQRRRRIVRSVCAVTAVLAVVGGLVAGGAAGRLPVVTMAVAVLGALAVAGRRERVPATPVALAVAAASLLGTVFGDPPVHRQSTGVVTLVEIAATLVLLGLLARYAPVRTARALCPVLGVLASTVILRLQVPPTLREATAQSAFFALGAVTAGAVGGYLRGLDSRRLRSVRAARRQQRLELARDLHDFVAHDVSGIVVLAQAAQVVGADRPEQVLPILHRIEAAGLQALASMDRTVRMLDDSAGAGRSASGAGAGAGAGAGVSQVCGLPDVADVVDRFRDTGRAEVRADIALAPEQIALVPREVASTAHRLVIEALTNIRRHAGTTPLVAVDVAVRCDLGRPGPAVLDVSVVNGAPSVGEPAGSQFGGGRHGGGTGLAGLAERVAALGGSLEYGPHGDGGWRVAATLPLD
ncbi:sensor histidine kinase [Streptomyces sp. NPDC048187]|uniref:sensor histidine kinase n=1 Tax=Streptomyces sp. NPDC048187 TaxID=3365509 RepID=UPI003724A27B